MKKITVLLLLVFSFSLFGADDIEVDNELRRVKREIKRIKQERLKVKKEALQDKKEFASYMARTKERKQNIISETDSVRKEIVQFQKKSSTLGSRLNSLTSQQKNYDYKQKHLKEQLMKICDRAITTAKGTLPSLQKKSIDALKYLQSELAVGTVDNTEAIHRLVQILESQEQQLMDISVAQAPSPITDIHGSVFYLRLGGVFEAIVDTKGKKSAIWDGSKWDFINDPVVSGEILRATQIRTGKTLPDFVKLPYSVNASGGK